MTAAAEEEYRRLEEESNQKGEEWEALRSRLAELSAGYDRLQAALGALEAHPTAGNGQDNAPAEEMSKHIVAGAPEVLSGWNWGTHEQVQEPEQPHTEPMEDVEPPPEAA
jgi:hypothetical protein